MSGQKREGWEGREAEKKKEGRGGERGECALSVLGPGGVHPRQGVEIPLQLPAFFFCLFLFTHLTRLGHIFSWHHVPSYLFTRRMKLQQSCLKHENNGGSGRQRCHLRLNYHNKTIKMQVLVLFLCQLKHLEGEHDQNYKYRKHAKKKSYGYSCLESIANCNGSRANPFIVVLLASSCFHVSLNGIII